MIIKLCKWIVKFGLCGLILTLTLRLLYEGDFISLVLLPGAIVWFWEEWGGR